MKYQLRQWPVTAMQWTGDKAAAEAWFATWLEEGSGLRFSDVPAPYSHIPGIIRFRGGGDDIEVSPGKWIVVTDGPKGRRIELASDARFRRMYEEVSE